MKIDIEGIKDAVYEFEGLLELAELREDKLQALLPLMKNKLDIINSLFSAADEENLALEDEEERIEETEEEAVIVDEEDHNIAEENHNIAEEKSEMSDEADVAPEYEEAETDEVEEVDNDNKEEAEEDDEEEEPVFVANDEEEQEEKKPVRAKLSVDTASPKPAFCINDRFRFRRELFNDSDAEFNSAMDLVATMEDYEEAEDYFIGDLGWDFEKPEVMDFMAIIRNYFDK
ncbi:MAG: hypothetical protein K2K81_02290 [Muribaculaceae bacterium]|nr:hypothetical protein [Muribaculaceae bacterium]